MKRNKRISILSTVVLGLGLLTAGCQQSGSREAHLNSKQDKISYIFGYNTGKNMKKQSIDSLNVDNFAAGLQEGLNGADSRIDQEEATKLMREYQQKVMQKQAAKRNAEAESNKKSSDEFLKNNKDKDGVHVTDSGLQYKILKKGDGASPDSNDTVTVQYEGRLPDGTVFDSSYKRGKPATFPVNGVIKGWTEALQMMHEGGEWELYIPSDLAYGQRGTQGPIGPNQALIFKVELQKVTKK